VITIVRNRLFDFGLVDPDYACQIACMEMDTFEAGGSVSRVPSAPRHSKVVGGACWASLSESSRRRLIALIDSSAGTRSALDHSQPWLSSRAGQEVGLRFGVFEWETPLEVRTRLRQIVRTNGQRLPMVSVGPAG